MLLATQSILSNMSLTKANFQDYCLTVGFEILFWESKANQALFLIPLHITLLTILNLPEEDGCLWPSRKALIGKYDKKYPLLYFKDII